MLGGKRQQSRKTNFNLECLLNLGGEDEQEEK